MIGANNILKHHRNNGQSSYLWRPNNMQNNMRTIHVGIFHLFQKNKQTKKKHAGYKNPDTAASHH